MGIREDNAMRTVAPSTSDQPNPARLDYVSLVRLQVAFLILVSVVLLLAAPPAFNTAPDSGFYIGGAQSILMDGSYRFNGQPILIYYPGFSLLLTLPIAIFGVDFQILHLFSAGFAIFALWMVRAYMTTKAHFIAGLLAPVMLVFAEIFQYQVIHILSDMPFLGVSFAALILWRRYVQTDDTRMLIACAALVAYAPMLRFQGLFVLGAFALALGMRQFDRKALGKWVLSAGGIAFLTALPFILWTIRNYFAYTPDAYNMANSFFFGQKGLALYDGEFEKVDWIDADWKYGFYNLLFSIRDLAVQIFGRPVEYWIRVDLVPLLLAVPILLGVKRWWQNATVMERVYVLVSLAFIAWKALSSRSLYTVPRYWLPLLPFILLIGIHGLGVIYRTTSNLAIGPLVSAILVSLGLLVTGHGTVAMTNKLNPWIGNYYREADQTRLALAAYIHQNAPADATVAVTDWGVLPLTLERKTVSVLNDPDRVLSLQRIVRARATHLVILEGTSAMVEPAQRMAEELPSIFLPKLLLDPPDSEGGAVYEIDISEAERELERRQGL